MVKLSVGSKEFQQVLHNLRLENMTLTIELQRKVIEVVNRNEIITPKLIQRIVADGEI
ncbi:Zn-dependent hydrolase [Rubeoparvulum massiliense]|uniref:Zn-dependent hydrolase n=1 Tax=Rubeoparvulum massiliense TaxID=1631346 RepID=UPI0011CBE762|nr:Zn-dependent hydrolase [Rubeoparvulum massiliense]